MASFGSPFKLQIFTKRWGHYDTYQLTLEETGWRVNHKGISGPCDKEGAPFLFKNLEHDSVSYPAGLKYLMHELHDKHNRMSDEEVQAKLDEIADWISATEKATPEIG